MGFGNEEQKVDSAQVTGGCRCGAVRYTLAMDVLPLTYACHCHLCQRWSGSAFSQNALVPETALSIDGPVETFEIVTGDRVSTQRSCAVCRGRVYNTNTGRPGLVIVRAGTLDLSEETECVAHIFIGYRQHWLAIPEGVRSWPEAPDPETFLRLLTLPDSAAL